MTVKEVIDTMNRKEKSAMYRIVGESLSYAKNPNNSTTDKKLYLALLNLFECFSSKQVFIDFRNMTPEQQDVTIFLCHRALELDKEGSK